MPSRRRPPSSTPVDRSPPWPSRRSVLIRPPAPADGARPKWTDGSTTRASISIPQIDAGERVPEHGHHRAPAPYGDRSGDRDPTDDLWTYRGLGPRATGITGYPSISTWHDVRYHPKGAITGVSTDWAHEHLGLDAWGTEFWNVLTAAGLDDADPLEWNRRHPLDEEPQLLAWVDERVDDHVVQAMSALAALQADDLGDDAAAIDARRAAGAVGPG